MVNKDLKAYQVDTSYDGSFIVFSVNGLSAMREVIDGQDICKGEIEECVRRPVFDKYSPKHHVPHKVLMEEHGWRFPCCVCSDVVIPDDDQSRVWIDDDNVKCGECC